MAVGITPILKWSRSNARIDQTYVREILGEFFATLILCWFAIGTTCNINAMGFKPQAGGPTPSFGYGNSMSVISLAFGYFLVTLLFGGVSGAHVNPAVSIGMAVAGKLSWIKLHAFILVQFLGGYIGCLLGYLMFKAYFDSFDYTTTSLKDTPDSVALFIPNAGYISIGAGFLNEIALSTVFMMAFLSIKDMLNTHSPRYMQGFLVALVFIGLGLAFGETTAVIVNPVRDICPRLAALTFGWNSDFVMKGVLNQQWWAVGFFAPFIGAIIGAFLYIFLIGAQLNYDDPDDPDQMYVPRNESPSQPGPNADHWKSTVFVPRLSPQGVPTNQTVSPYARVQFAQQR